MLLPALILAGGLQWPLTVPESTDFARTSTYAEVITFLEALQSRGAPMKLTWIGESTEGRKIPLVIAADPPVANAQEARSTGRLVVYIQGNIHAGEVEGKESAQMLLRSIAQRHSERKSTLLKHMVLLVNPIYNADGNEKFGPVERNRPEQDGPAQVGVRPNGQGFDLNRDCIKAESPEMRSALDNVYGAWDPDVVIDLHTTDGTRHGYDLTYSPPLNPNTDPRILEYTQRILLPDVRRDVKRRHGIELFDYGNAERASGATAWRTFGQEARYVTNYAGIAGRIGILSEATTYIPFKARIEATNVFMDSVLAHLARNVAKIGTMRQSATLPSELGVRFEMAQGREEAVLLEKLTEGEARPRGGRPKVVEPIRMPIFDRFRTTRTAKVPAAYLLPGDRSTVVRLLQRHGVRVERLGKAWRGNADAFVVSEFSQDRQAFQGRRLIRLEGKFETRSSMEWPSDTWVIPLNQRLARLAFHLLEPESLDGVFAWGFMGEEFPIGGPVPIYKVATWER